MRRILTWALWLILILGVVAVGYYAWQYLSADPEPSGPELILLVCTDECAARGQCGTTTESPEAPVVLGGRNGPAVEPQQHDVFFVSGASVEVRNRMDVTLVDQEGVEFTHPFSRVEFRNAIGDIAQTGWVPEWCVERP